MSHPNLLNNSRAVLVVIDIQDPLLKAIHESERVVTNTIKLIEAAKVLSVPIIVTLQYAQRLGDVTQSIADVLPHNERLDKRTFSCVRGPGFKEALSETGRDQVILCGIETHVCVNQTAHDLLDLDYSVHIISDAISSRTAENRSVGIDKMRDSGCVIASTEMVIFELTEDSTRPEFKQILPIVK